MDIARASIQRRVVVMFICLLLVAGGMDAYFKIGKLEDPAFTIKTAIVSASYPGSTAYEAEEEVANRLEDAIQSMGEVKRIRTKCSPGSVHIEVDIKDTYTAKDLPQVWNVLRQKINDVQPSLPPGCSVYINNDFGDVFGQYYALTGDGFSTKELHDYANFLKKELVLIPEVAKVGIIGERAEAIYVEFSLSRLTSLKISTAAIFNVLNQHNTISSMGKTFYGDQYVTINPSGGFLSVEDIGEMLVGEGDNLVKLKDIASIRRDIVNPQSMYMLFNGTPAIGIGIATVEGGNVVNMGNAITKRLEELEKDSPVGMELHEIYMQSEGVIKSVNDFVLNLVESIVIVVGVLFIFMGLRTGLMIGIVLLMTVAATIWVMNQAGIFLQMVSLAALIIALGSLVDNAIVVAEGMLIGVQNGVRVEDSASKTVNDSIWAMLGGTLIAVLAFVPIGLSPDNTGEYCRSLFQVVGISMLLSWVLAVTVTPALGSYMLKPSKQEGDPYDKFLFRAYKTMLEWCLRHRFFTMALVGVMFFFSIMSFSLIKTIFFPSSTALYFTADIWQREGMSITSQLELTKKFEERLRKNPEIKNITSFVGQGSLRFSLTYSPPSSSSSFSELLVEIKENGNPHEVLREAQRIIDEEMPGVDGVCKLFSKGSSSSAPIEVRIYGDDPDVLRSLARQAKNIIEDDPLHSCTRIDWEDRVRVFRPMIRKDRMQSLGLTRRDINQAIASSTTGYAVGAFREEDNSIPIIMALSEEERNDIENLRSVPVWSPVSDKTVPLNSVVYDIKTVFEDNVLRRRNRKRVIAVTSEVRTGMTVSAMQNRIQPKIDAIELPPGYTLEWGGEVESQDDAMSSMSKMFTPCLLLMFVIMVFLFNGFRQPLIIFVSIPLIIIGVAVGLLMTNLPLSFMAIIGILSLVGMLAKNSIVLLDQVATDFAAGKDRYQTIVDTGVSRLRPVAMSAITTVLGMLPLIWDSLFNSMAAAIMGGLTVSTILTMIFIPVATAIAYNVPCPEDGEYEEEYEEKE